MIDPLHYQGTSAAVTGASSGIGEAAARLLVDLGVEVTAIDIKPTNVPVAHRLTVDLRDKSAIEEVATRLGPIDAFFNCAGVPGPPFSGGANLSPVDVMVVNFVGPRHLIELTLPSMPAGSAVAYVASASGLAWKQKLNSLLALVESDDFDAGKAWCEAHPEIGEDTYFFSKEVINAWIAWRSSSLIREQGIRINCTNPGSVETPMMDVFRGLMPDPPVGPIGRLSTPEEQAWPLLMLNSPRFSYVTGQ
jgi:NAD(P)-dependent dehydrogenase (short-subunit alcohol dehydrogenase family)